MATIATIGLRIAVQVDDLERGLRRAQDRLGSFRTFTSRIASGFSNIKAGFQQIVAGIASFGPLIRATGPLLSNLSRAAMNTGRAFVEAALGFAPFFTSLAKAAAVFAGGSLRLGFALARTAADFTLYHTALALLGRERFENLRFALANLPLLARLFVSQMGTRLMGGIRGLINPLRSVDFEGVFATLMRGAGRGVRRGFTGFASLFSPIFGTDGRSPFFVRMMGATANRPIAGLLGWNGQQTRSMFARMGASILGGWNFLTGILDKVPSPFRGLRAAISRGLQEIAADIGPHVARVLRGAGMAFGALLDVRNVPRQIADVFAPATRMVKLFFLALQGTASTKLGFLGETAAHLRAAFASLAGPGFTRAGGFLAAAWERMKLAGGNLGPVIRGVGGALGGLVDITAGLGKVLFGALQIGFAVAVPVLGVFAAVAGAAAVAALGLGYTFIRLALAGQQAAMAVVRMGDEFGISYNSMKLLIEMAKRSGTDGATLEHWLRGLETNLAGVANGSYESLRVFRMLGLKGRELAAMPLDEAFIALINHMRALPSHYERARIAQQLFSRDYQKLLAIVNNPTIKSIEDLRERMGKSGQLLDDSEVDRLRQAQAAIDDIKGAFEGALTQLALRFAPVVEVVGKRLTEWMDSLGGVKNLFANLTGTLLNIGDILASVAVEWVRGSAASLSIWAQIYQVVAQMGARSLRAVSVTFDALAMLPGGDMFAGTGDGLRKVADTLEKGLDPALAAADEKARKFSSVADEIEKTWKSIRAEIEKVAAGADAATKKAAGKKVLDDALGFARRAFPMPFTFAGALGIGGKEIGGGVPRFAGRLRDLEDKKGRFREMPVGEKFRDDINHIDMMVKEKLLTPTEGMLARFKAFTDVESSLGLQHYKAPPLLRTESEGAGSAVVAAINQQSRYNPQTRIVQLLEEAKNRDELRLKYSREISDALKKVKVAKF